jgi:hypothetical protein
VPLKPRSRQLFELFAVRENVAPTSWTTFELMSFLTDNGWEKCIHRGRSIRNAYPAYTPGGQKILYMSNKSSCLPKAYLLALVLVETGKLTLAVPHMRNNDVYMELIFPDKPKKRRRVSQSLMVDDDGANPLGLEEAAEIEDCPLSEADPDDLFGDSASSASSSSSSDEASTSSASSSASKAPSAAASSHTGDPGPPGLSDGPPPSNTAPLPPPAPAAAEPNPGMDGRRRRRHAVEPPSFWWGQFMFTWRPATEKSAPRWQARCFWHRDSLGVGECSGTWCTRTRRIGLAGAPDAEGNGSPADSPESLVTLRMLKAWCLACVSAESKRAHQSMLDEQEVRIPPDAELNVLLQQVQQQAEASGLGQALIS